MMRVMPANEFCGKLAKSGKEALSDKGESILRHDTQHTPPSVRIRVIRSIRGPISHTP